MADIIEEIGDLIPDSDDQKGVRTTEQVVEDPQASDGTSNDNTPESGDQDVEDPQAGHIYVTVDKLVTVEEVVAVLVEDSSDDTYRPFNTGANDGDLLAATSSLETDDAGGTETSIGDNVVIVEPYTADTNGAPDEVVSENDLTQSIKVIARGA